jgi:hypothetical protein
VLPPRLTPHHYGSYDGSRPMLSSCCSHRTRLRDLFLLHHMAFDRCSGLYSAIVAVNQLCFTSRSYDSFSEQSPPWLTTPGFSKWVSSRPVTSAPLCSLGINVLDCRSEHCINPGATATFNSAYLISAWQRSADDGLITVSAYCKSQSKLVTCWYPERQVLDQ